MKYGDNGGKPNGGYGVDEHWEIEAGRLSANHIALEREHWSHVAESRKCKEDIRSMLGALQDEVIRLSGIMVEYSKEQKELHLDVQMIATYLQKGDHK